MNEQHKTYNYVFIFSRRDQSWHTRWYRQHKTGHCIWKIIIDYVKEYWVNRKGPNIDPCGTPLSKKAICNVSCKENHQNPWKTTYLTKCSDR